MKDSDLYNKIVKKLGFEPKDYVFNSSHTENDQSESPLSILTLEELRYLMENNFFRTISKKKS